MVSAAPDLPPGAGDPPPKPETDFDRLTSFYDRFRDTHTGPNQMAYRSTRPSAVSGGEC